MQSSVHRFLIPISEFSLKKLIFVFILFWVFFSFSNCSQKKDQLSGIKSKEPYHLDSLPLFIENRFIQGSTVFCDYATPWIDSLKMFYQDKDFKSLWIDLMDDIEALKNEVNRLQRIAHQHGFNPHWYHFDWIRDDLIALKNSPDAHDILKKLAEFEVAFSESKLRLASDICNGRNHPKAIFGKNYMLPMRPSSMPSIDEILKDENSWNVVEQIHQSDTHYVFLQQLYQDYAELISGEEPDPIDFSKFTKIELGYQGAEIRKIIQRLKFYQKDDSATISLLDTNVYTKALAQVIKKFQQLNQLDNDGVIGYHTMVCLNKGYREITQEISVAMERQRWFTIPENKPFVLVNLAYFTTYLYYEDSIKMMDVCIGKGLPPLLEKVTQDMRTPQIYSKVHSVVINPTWTVPYSIVRKEMLPKLKRDPKYLERNNYLVYRNGESVNPDSIDWSKYSVNNIPFKIVQSPGGENALGKVKYLFHNPFAIYMHDTPIKSAFSLKTRAVSHGCVRLKEPLLFGEFIMQGSKKYTSDEFRMKMGHAPLDEDLLKEWEEGDSTFLAKYKTDSIKSIWLENPIPIYFDYRTIFVDESNQTRIIHDVYGYNRKIWAAIRKD